MRVRDLTADALEAFVVRGHKERHFFPHRVIRLTKGGVDGLKLARRMCGDVQPDQLRQLVLYALPPVVAEFPTQVFFDDDIIWHQQQFGLPGHVATASLVLVGSDLYVPTLISDLVQRIGRRRELKTRIENRFKGWARLLVHAALDFAIDVGAQRLLVADPDLALEHTDRARQPERPLFDWVYEHSVGPPFHATHRGRWWVLDVRTNADKVVRPSTSDVPVPPRSQVFVCHEIERGWGHLYEDPAFAAEADRAAPTSLVQMLAYEHAAGARATYSVLGILFDEVSPLVRNEGHAVGFHSYDHADPGEEGATEQLGRCREIDYRVKGYRPPKSALGPELTDANLALHNFEWLATSAHSLGYESPILENGIVKIPILFDDFDLHCATPYAEWATAAIARLRRVLERGDPAVFSLHDCYAPTWLHAYPELLQLSAGLGSFGTLDQLAAATLLSASS